MRTLVKYSKDIDLKSAKNLGYNGIIFDESVPPEIIQKAKKSRFKSYIYLPHFDASAGEIGIISEKFDDFDGFLMPVPKYEDKLTEKYLLDIFNKTDDKSLSEIGFYEKIQNCEFGKRILPICKAAKENKKEIIFDFGTMASQYDEFKYFISKDVYLKYGIMTASEKDGTVKTDFDTKNKILVIAPIRKIMQNYVLGEKLNKTETVLNLALSEIRYFRNSLNSKGYGFNMVGDFAVKSIKLLKYEKIIICESCIFDYKEIKSIKRAEAGGISINDEALLNELDNMY